MVKNQSSIKLSKKTLYLSTALLVIIIVAILAFTTNKTPETPEQVIIPENIEEINVYKKALFDSTVCQYTCPLTEQEFQGTQQLLPDRACITTCVNNLKESGFNNTAKEYNLLLDPMVADVESTIINCRVSNTEDEKINNEDFFTCSGKDLELLRGSYEYLN